MSLIASAVEAAAAKEVNISRKHYFFVKRALTAQAM